MEPCSSSSTQPIASETTEEIYPNDSVAHKVIFNPVILQRLLNFTQKSEWKSLRLVSKAWTKLLLKVWRENVYVNFTDLGSGNTNYLHGLTFISTFHPDANLEDPYSFGRYPFRKMRTMPGMWVELCPEQNPFWAMCGTWLKTLDLHQAEIVDTEAFEQLLFEWTPNLKVFEWTKCLSQERQASEFEYEYKEPDKKQLNLTEVRITMMESESSDDDLQPNFPISWMQLFSSCPNLTSLTLSSLPSSTFATDFESIIQAIESVRIATNEEALKLTEIHTLNIVHPELLNTIDQSFSPFAVNMLTLCNLPVETLSLNVAGLSVDDFEKLLRSYELTIKKLYLRGRNVDVCHFPCEVLSENITELQLHGAIFKNWDFLAHIPNIETLQVLAQKWPQTNMANVIEKPVSPLVRLTKFEYQTGGTVEKEFMERLVALMPNVTAVGITLDSPTFPVLCDGWPQLEKLVIHTPNVEEQVFVEHAHKLINLKRLSFCDMELNGVVFPVSGVFAHGRFADASIPEGFLRMRRLDELSIVFAPEVSLDALSALKNGIRNTANVFVSSTEPDMEPVPLSVALDVPTQFATNNLDQLLILWQR